MVIIAGMSDDLTIIHVLLFGECIGNMGSSLDEMVRRLPQGEFLIMGIETDVVKGKSVVIRGSASVFSGS